MSYKPNHPTTQPPPPHHPTHHPNQMFTECHLESTIYQSHPSIHLEHNKSLQGHLCEGEDTWNNTWNDGWFCCCAVVDGERCGMIDWMKWIDFLD